MRPARPYSPEGTLAALLFVALILVVVIQILGRTPLLRGPVWTEEAARWIWVWMAFVGMAEVERQNRHLRMGFLGGRLPDRLRGAVFAVVDLVYAGVMIQICVIGWRTVGRTLAASSVTLPLPTAALYAAAFVASGLIVLRILLRLVSGRSGAIEESGLS